MKRYEEFAKERKIDIIESYTNFITLCLNETQDATKISNALLQKGMIVRNLASYGMNAIRVTIGTPVQNDRFFALFCELI
jgi:histidinol-phosphate aminotransferase